MVHMQASSVCPSMPCTCNQGLLLYRALWSCNSAVLETHYHALHCALQAKHSLLLEVLGERHERVEQLEEDVRDMKAIFHQQLNVAVDQLAQARAELERLGADVGQLKSATGTLAAPAQEQGQQQQHQAQQQSGTGRGDTDQRDGVGRE